jgi:chorismate dehydratase
MLRIGCVKYLNARPLIHGWEGDVEFDHPSVLCRRLAMGQLDVALVSSFEFLRNPIYWIVDDVSISSDGPVYSVVVAHRRQITDIEDIEIDPASETSANLLHCLVAERGLNPRLVQRSTAVRPVVTEPETRRRAYLLIGDQAIRFRQESPGIFRFWDLGEQWKKLVDLPFVYALWLIRPEVADPKQIAKRLRDLRDENFARLDDVIEDAVAWVGKPNQPKGVDREFLSRYYCEHLRFSFGETEKGGLRTFANLCIKHGLLPKRDLAFRIV